MDKPIKIAHIMISASGIDTYVRTTLQNINHEHFKFIIIQSKTDYKSFEEIKPSVKSYKIPLQRAINPLTDLIALIKTLLILNKEKPDLIHCHSSKGGVIGRIAGKILNIKTLYTPHAFSYLSTEKNFKASFFRKIEKILFFKNTHLLACSYSEEDRARIDLKIPEELLNTWENSISPSLHLLENTDIELPAAPYICTVGRPSYQKNIEFLIDVFNLVHKKLPKLKFVIAGVGYYSPNLEAVKEKIKTYKLQDSVILLPWTSRNNIFKLIKNSECYVSSSRYEGLPYVLIESIALGVPCVVSNVDGNRDIIHENKNGFLIAENDIHNFSVKIARIVMENELQERLKNGALEIFNANYNLKKNIHKLEEIYLSKAIC